MHMDWKRSMLPATGFDLSTERTVANMDNESVAWRARLYIDDLPILWSSADQHNPDLLAIEPDGTHWVFEIR